MLEEHRVLLGHASTAKRAPLPTASPTPSRPLQSREARVAANGGKPLDPNAPLIAHANGSSYTIKEMRTLIRNAAVAIGLSAADFGAHSSRIGGATEGPERTLRLGDKAPLPAAAT